MPPRRLRLRRPARRVSPRALIATGLAMAAVALVVGLVLPKAAPPSTVPAFTPAGAWSLLDLQRHLEAGDVAAVTTTGQPGAPDGAMVAKTTDGTLVPVALGVSAAEASRALAALGYQDALTAEAWASARAASGLAAGSDPVRSVASLLVSAVLLLGIGILGFGLVRGGLRNLPGRRRQASFAVVHPPTAGATPGSASGGPGVPNVRLEDVAGCDEAKHELTEVIEFLREPDRFV